MSNLDQEILQELKKEMIILNAKALAASQVYRNKKMEYCYENYRFKKGQKIKVKWADGTRTYIFERLDWSFSSQEEPAIFATEILKSGKYSKNQGALLYSSNGAIAWDSMSVSAL